jgi:hypothetical protein
LLPKGMIELLQQMKSLIRMPFRGRAKLHAGN